MIKSQAITKNLNIFLGCKNLFWCQLSVIKRFWGCHSGDVTYYRVYFSTKYRYVHTPTGWHLSNTISKVYRELPHLLEFPCFPSHQIPILYYRPRRSCEGYVFTPVCHSVHGGGSASVHAGIPPHPQGAGTPPPEHPGTRSPRSRQPTPPGAETATAADDTHPTGMHSCYL